MNCFFESEGNCVGPVQLHHCCEKQWLRKRFPYGAVWSHDRDRLLPLERMDLLPREAVVATEELLADSRNLVPLCSETHHEAVTNRRRYVEWPASVWEFAHETGLASKLEKQLERAV